MDIRGRQRRLISRAQRLERDWRHRPHLRYVAITDGDGREAIDGRCVECARSTAALGLVNGLELYKRLLDGLVQTGVEVCPLSELMAPAADERHRVALRHDVDADILTGTRCARELAARGLGGSFYLLHTSHYYGTLFGSVFIRTRGLASYVKELLDSGCEVGLHTDGLSLYLEHGIDGSAAVSAEIRWLRKHGAQVKGTVAHNSAAAYGAENFELFREYQVGGRKRVQRDGGVATLGQLSSLRLGLTYEGNFPVCSDTCSEESMRDFLRLAGEDAIRSESWLRRYLIDNPMFERGYDASIWLLGRDRWAIATHFGEQRDLRWPVDLAAVLRFVNDTRARRTVLVLHPIYFSGDLVDSAS